MCATTLPNLLRICAVSALLATLLSASARPAKSGIPNCASWTANITARVELAIGGAGPGSGPTNLFPADESRASDLVEGALGMPKAEMQRRFPGVHDWATSAVLRALENPANDVVGRNRPDGYVKARGDPLLQWPFIRQFYTEGIFRYPQEESQRSRRFYREP